MHYYFALLGFTFPDILYSICTQTTQQEPGNQHKHWISELHFFIQTPLRTAFHDTQRLLLETYASNMCSDFVLFAQLMKK